MPLFNLPVEQVEVGDKIGPNTVHSIRQFGRAHAQHDGLPDAGKPYDDEHHPLPFRVKIQRAVREENRTFKIGGATHFILVFDRHGRLSNTLEKGSLVEVFRPAAKRAA